MQYKSYEEINRLTINQIAAMYSDAEPGSILDYKILFLKLLNDIEKIEVTEIDKQSELKQIFKPMLQAPKLAPPPGWKERFDTYGQGR